MIHPIENESYKVLSEQFDFSPYTPYQKAVIQRVIHASADFELAGSLIFSEHAIEKGIKALRRETKVICDVEMVRAGITKYPTTCYLSSVQASPSGFPTRSYSAISIAARENSSGAIFVVGCAPTALTALVELADESWFQPALIIGLPVGFIGAKESKDLLSKTNLPYITNAGLKGGSAVASAAFNAILRLATTDDDELDKDEF